MGIHKRLVLLDVREGGLDQGSIQLMEEAPVDVDDNGGHLECNRVVAIGYGKSVRKAGSARAVVCVGHGGEAAHGRR